MASEGTGAEQEGTGNVSLSQSHTKAAGQCSQSAPASRGHAAGPHSASTDPCSYPKWLWAHKAPLLSLPPQHSPRLSTQRDASSFPSIPSSSPLLRQDRAAEASCRPLWHATPAFWLRQGSCTQRQTETWQPLCSLHRPAEPSPASPAPQPSAFMGILQAHRTENRDPGWGLLRILA